MKIRELIGPLESGKDVKDLVTGRFAEEFPVGIVFNAGELVGADLLKAAKKLMPDFGDVPVVRPCTGDEIMEMINDVTEELEGAEAEEETEPEIIGPVDGGPVIEEPAKVEEIPVAEVEESVDSVTDSNETVEEIKPEVVDEIVAEIPELKSEEPTVLPESEISVESLAEIEPEVEKPKAKPKPKAAKSKTTKSTAKKSGK